MNSLNLLKQPSHRAEQETYRATAPEAVAAVLALDKATKLHGLEPEILELVKLRVSQINGCAFCLQMHDGVAEKLGVSAAKLTQIAAWHDSPVFSDRERAALAWAEALTLLPSGVPDDLYDAVKTVFNSEQLVDLSFAIGTINVWNRISVPFRFAPQA